MFGGATPRCEIAFWCPLNRIEPDQLKSPLNSHSATDNSYLSNQPSPHLAVGFPAEKDSC